MSANVETMFSVRETPWHGLGRIVMDAPASREALELADLDWQVESRNIYSGTGAMIPGYRANVRSTDDAVLGVVSDRYRIVQNEEAFQFTDDLLGEGVTYETAGSLQGGRKVWMLAKLPEKYIIAGDEVTPYLVFFNSHDGSSGVKVAMTPVRVVCQNTLNLALSSAKRIWTARHTENVMLRVQDARETLQLANSYMSELGKGIYDLTTIKLSDRKVQEFINEFFPVTEDMTDGQRKNNLRLQEELKARYYDAPDLAWVGKNGWRFVNAVSDFATHADPIRKTRNYNENLFLRTAEGNPMIDKANKMLLAAKRRLYINDECSRVIREFSEFLDDTNKKSPAITDSIAYEITIKSTISTILQTLDAENKMEERFWNHLRVQRNILDFLYVLWLDDDRSLVDEFSYVIEDLVQEDFEIAEANMKARMKIA